MNVPVLKKVLALSWGYVEMVLFAGTIDGWPSLVHVLSEEGVYSHVCTSPANITNGTDGPHPTCSDQQNILNLVYTLTVVTFHNLAFPLGWLFDKIGLWASRTHAR